jgi:hypothetical protein
MKRSTAVLTIGMLAIASLSAGAQDPARLADGVRIPVRLMQRLSSETAKTGDPVTFEVLEDVIVNGEVVIKQGTPARGVVVEAAPKRRMGRAGKLSYTISETKTIDRVPVRLRATQQSTGGSSVTSTAVATTAVAVLVPVAAPFVLLRKGKDLVVAENTRIDAFVDGEHTLQPSVTKTAASAEQRVTQQGALLTNADIVNLKSAGLGDEVLITKIETSLQDFKLAASDLVELKKAGLSDHVIAAMLKAAQRN